MKKFNSIEQFRNVVTHVRRNCEFHGIPLPTITFEGTVKLHGTNGSVRLDGNKIVAFSRERELTREHDNAGFFQFVLNKESIFRTLLQYIAAVYQADPYRFTIFGEWCGGNIQSKVGLNKLEKHFVIFNVWDTVEEKYINRDWMQDMDGLPLCNALHNNQIHLITEIPSYGITIDFNTPETAIENLERLTLDVENSCPWTEYRGQSGIGEGICWVSVDNINDTALWFKTKGLKHKGKAADKPKTLSVDPVKVAAIRELVEVLLPEWRLEQGAAWLKENGYNLDTSSTGQYLQWVMRDVLKEESDTLAANSYEWKELTGYLTTKARSWFFGFLNTASFSS